MSAILTTYDNDGENVGGDTDMLMTMNIESNRMKMRTIIKETEERCWTVIIIAKLPLMIIAG